jgi:hypothetical protein
MKNEPDKRYEVWSNDNFHYMDAKECIFMGEYGSLEEAEAECRRIVEESVRHLYLLGIKPDKFYDRYINYGEDPFVVGGDPKQPRFSAWDYAKALCERICPDIEVEA